jgi:nucleoside-diphosphate-sugar epimerase
MKALITGITGQDGSYLAEFLLSKHYDVYGMIRRSSTETCDRIDHIKDRITLVQGDLLDQLSLVNILDDVQPDEVESTDTDRRIYWIKRDEVIGSDPGGESGNPVLPGVVIGNVR